MLSHWLRWLTELAPQSPQEQNNQAEATDHHDPDQRWQVDSSHTYRRLWSIRPSSTQKRPFWLGAMTKWYVMVIDRESPVQCNQVVIRCTSCNRIVGTNENVCHHCGDPVRGHGVTDSEARLVVVVALITSIMLTTYWLWSNG